MSEKTSKPSAKFRSEPSGAVGAGPRPSGGAAGRKWKAQAAANIRAESAKRPQAGASGDGAPVSREDAAAPVFDGAGAVAHGQAEATSGQSVPKAGGDPPVSGATHRSWKAQAAAHVRAGAAEAGASASREDAAAPVSDGAGTDPHEQAGPTSGQSVPKFRAGPSGGGADPGNTGADTPKRPKFHAKSQQERVSEAKLRMERQGEKLERAKYKLSRQKPVKPPGPVKKAGRAAAGSVHAYVHGKIYENEHENVGIEGAHRSELAAESVLRTGSQYVRRKLRQHPAKAVHRAEARYVKASAEHSYRAAALEHPELQKSAVSRLWHKQQAKRQYVKRAREAAKTSAKAAEKTAVTTEKLAVRTVAFVKRHPVAVLILLACVLLIVALQSCASSMLTVGNGAVGAIGASTYPAEDADLRGAEAAYCALEAELQSYLDTYTSTHDYDEYHFELDSIEHDPYVLLSLVSAWHGGDWTLDEVEATLQMLFDRQYILNESVAVEVRYRTETYTWTDEEGTHTESYQVPYNYYICTVTLENFNLSHLPIYIMGEEQLSRYALYMATLGNRPDLFPSSVYVGKYITNPPADYDVPEAYLADETFAAIHAEAEKYLGYPYVWGGYQPSTSFDCSGFVSYVYNQCGWDFGRLGAQGLYNICTPTSAPRPGDLVFFVGTYDTPGISHCGIYVGDGMMIHAGDPIQYASLDTSYWQSHFYAYGRMP